MHTVRKFWWLIALTGCPQDGPTGHSDSDTGTPGTQVKVFTFVEEVPATDFTANVSEQALAAHQISTMFLAANALVAADGKVQDRLNVDGGGGYLRDASVQCWSRPEFPMFSFAIDYTSCANYLIAGGVYINDHPSGPLLFEYSNFAIGQRTMGGVVAFDTRDAYPEALYWQVYNTESSNPGLDNLVPLGVNLGGVPYGVSYSGGAALSFLEREWAAWGILTVGTGKDAIQVVHGAVDAADVAPDEPTGADVLSSSLDWLTCRCPTSGVQSQDMSLHFDHLTVDIDDLEDVPDAVDDPVLDIDVTFDAPGRVVLNHTGCGTYDVEFTSDAVEIPITSDQIEGAISFKCSTFEISDPARCQALLSAASRLSDGASVQITNDQMVETAQIAVSNEFDTNWCVVQ